MEQGTIDKLIINGPYEEPKEFWRYNPQTRGFSREKGRRTAGYLRASQRSKTADDPGLHVEIPLVNEIRPRVRAWAEAGYPGVTSMTRRLLEYWTDPEEFESRRFFFCQLEAAETLIWLNEASENEKVGLDIPGDGGAFRRLCSKMATGTGKTVVMAMVIAWHILNKVTYPQDPRFSKNVLVIAPGLTVKNRLAVLQPKTDGNFYESFGIVPPSLMEKLRNGTVMIHNWHVLNWEDDEQIAKKKSVDKRGAKSDQAYVREVLEDMANARNLLVINDEAHHAWRSPEGAKTKGVEKAALEQATKWVGGLDRIHRARGIHTCYDFSATPFVPSGHAAAEESLFSWIVSDFGLNDAIESGLVKTPRVVVRDDAVPDAKTYKSRFYHLYNDDDVRDDLNRKAQPHEPLPDLVTNAYYLLGYDWRETAKLWSGNNEDLEEGEPEEKKHKTPPVMITVANRTETAARIRHAFERGSILIDELCDPDRILHIDSTVLKKAEEADAPSAGTVSEQEEEPDEDDAPPKRMNATQRAEHLRRMVDTVGKAGLPGEQIQNVISVGMLSEGWDAKTVTHIMGLRAFSSQLLCEQVVGRGLRRTSYDIGADGMFTAEYVNIFGIPFTFLPHESDDDVIPRPEREKTEIRPLVEKAHHEIKFPNIIRVEHVLRPKLSLDPEKTRPLVLNASETAQIAELARIVDGQPDVSQISSIDLENLAREYRTQRIIFETARDVFDQMRESWTGSSQLLIGQLVRLVEQYITSGAIHITPPLFYQDELRRRLTITLNMTKVVQHIWEAIQFENTERLEPVFDPERPIKATGDMRPWLTSKPCGQTNRSHINLCVYDSTWEASDTYELDRNDAVESWVKNDHLGFEILYVHRGVVRKYRPDFVVRLRSGEMMVLETKGQQNEQTDAKRRALETWIRAVNQHGGFGKWSSAMATSPGEIKGILQRHAKRQ